ncbi:FAD synthase [Anopheles ziemanni]|uniref:FAD synthase n=1 Tax=Anopheles ziemanni TaxID=345580 RepID=UPI00265879DC|nr:FAD synthase isoform X1 [Anopheles coustani]XP_058172711.1 FAD synthase [Anopheles ziemanni]
MSKLKDSLRIIQQALSTYKPQEMFLSFNGGKDCTVLLDLIHNSMPKDAKGIKYIYVRPLNPFSEIEEFVELCREHYGITIATVTGGIKSALEVICKEDKQLKACIMGSRRSDPYCALLEPFKETDPGWPELMRINPLLEWTCDDIWAYIREHNVPYCTLYDRGYTSIGDKTNTVPNPHLKVDNNDEEATYLPAYALKDGDKYERAGRL